MHVSDLVSSNWLLITSHLAGLPQVTDIQTSTHEGSILVSWKAPLQPVRGYMIDYTHNGNQYYWKETKYTNATLFGRLDNGHV